jgi:hypothetical protein
MDIDVIETSIHDKTLAGLINAGSGGTDIPVCEPRMKPHRQE